MVEDAEHHTEAHVNDTDDHRHLHLIRVKEGQAVHGHVPDLQVNQTQLIRPQQTTPVHVSEPNTSFHREHVCVCVLTGSMPKGYGPEKTPETLGFKVSNIFDRRVSFLCSGKTRKTTICNDLND